MNILVTGGNGFIATNFIKIALSQNIQITSIDNMSYAGSLDNQNLFKNNNLYTFIKEDIRSSNISDLLTNMKFDAVINFAAESHVDRSIKNDAEFISTNINGTHNLISTSRTLIEKKLLPKNFKFIQISTDEVYGSLQLNDEPFTELSLLKPNNPYSASKASADLLAMSYYNTYNFPVIVTRCSNNYGPYQYPEKLIPLIINKFNMGGKVPIYGNGLQIRDWIFVDDHCLGIIQVLKKGKIGEIYNFGGKCEMTNIECLKTVIECIDSSNKYTDYIEYVKDRLGHDKRYAIDSTKSLNQLGWKPLETFASGIMKTISWYQNNQAWLSKKINTKEYKQWMVNNY